MPFAQDNVAANFVLSIRWQERKGGVLTPPLSRCGIAHDLAPGPVRVLVNRSKRESTI
jgi:hypothetical protein